MRVAPFLPVLCGLVLISARPAASQAPEDIPYVPTSPEVVDAMLDIAGVKKGDVVYDLGCGDGRIVITAAQKFQARGVGVDIDPERIREAEENARQANVTELVRFVVQDLFDTDIQEATVVMLYLGEAPNLRLRPKLLRELKVGTRIVSHDYDMGDWRPDNQVYLDHRTVYLWIVTEEAKRAFGGD